MTFTQALAEIRKHAEDRYVGITVEVTDNPRQGSDRLSVGYSVYIAGGIGNGTVNEDARTLECVVAMALDRLRPGPAEPVALLDAAFDLDDPRR